jgi:hypothetical protein
MTLLDQVSKFADGAVIIKDWLGDGAKTVAKVTAQMRADTCLKCPLHSPGNADGSVLTSVAAKAVKRYLEIKNQLKLRVVGEKSLRQCTVCSCEMRLKIWMPHERILSVTSDEEFDSLDKDCWIRSKP